MIVGDARGGQIEGNGRDGKSIMIVDVIFRNGVVSMDPYLQNVGKSLFALGNGNTSDFYNVTSSPTTYAATLALLTRRMTV